MNPKLVRLCEWTMFYDMVYQHPDRPSQDVIEDDELLDRWWAEQVKEWENKFASPHQRKSAGKSAWEHEEVIVFDS